MMDKLSMAIEFLNSLASIQADYDKMILGWCQYCTYDGDHEADCPVYRARKLLTRFSESSDENI